VAIDVHLHLPNFDKELKLAGISPVRRLSWSLTSVNVVASPSVGGIGPLN
jgi:hypothetical protein